MQSVRSRRAFLTFACLLTLAGCGGGNSVSNSSLTSGIKGQAVKGPLAPVTQMGQINTAPLARAIITVQQNGHEVARQITDDQGNFQFTLQAGAYQVVGLAPNEPLGFPTPPGPQTVTVPANAYVTITVEYDTGIR